MKQLTASQEIALGVRLSDITKLTAGIETLARRMKKDHSYIKDEYLQCLTDDADSVKELVSEIKNGTL